jgi:membrane-bound lytic murein transglycosylase D
MRKTLIQTLLTLGIMFLTLDGIPTGIVFAASDPFPVYECLKPNVAFWEKVYTLYSSKQGIFHDSSDLALIYGVIDLVDKKYPNACKINEARIRETKRKYESILEKLARGEAPSSAEEKRIAALFGPNAVSRDFLRAKENLRCQIGQKDRFEEGLVRSGAFIEQIKKIFESYGLPADLAYLPHVESSFKYEAYSRFGAAGIWQFMRSTGKRLMKIGYTIDERRDPIRSTHAAAKLLKGNYELLGDWPSAITAYNHGVFGILRAKQSLGSYEEIFKRYNGPFFKFASRNFYAEFLAARDVAKNYKRFFGELQLDKPAKCREVVLASYLPMSELVRQFGLDADVIRSLNPALRKPVYDGQKYIPKGYSLRLPISPGESPVGIPCELPQRIYKSQQKRSVYYTVQRGDTASEIARIEGIELSDLILANNLNNKATICVGQNLRISSSDEKRENLVTARLIRDKAYSPVHTESASAIKGEPAARVEVQIPTGGPSPASHERIKTAESPEINPSIVTGDLVVERVARKDGRTIGLIRAEVEETIGHYADWLSVSTHAIRKLNGWKNTRMMKLRELVRVPLNKVSKKDFEEKRLEYHKGMEEDFFGSYKVDDLKVYKIKDGDNIWTLCKEVFEVPLWLVVKYNPDLDFNSLRPSQELFIPVVEQRG